jgi:L-lactate dehydrogenase (cytochrome)
MYYHGAAEDEYTMAGNRQAFKHYWFRPRVLKGVENVDPSTKILGLPTALPIYISPAAWAGLGHPLGEVNLTKAAGRSGIIQGV